MRYVVMLLIQHFHLNIVCTNGKNTFRSRYTRRINLHSIFVASNIKNVQFYELKSWYDLLDWNILRYLDSIGTSLIFFNRRYNAYHLNAILHFIEKPKMYSFVETKISQNRFLSNIYNLAKNVRGISYYFASRNKTRINWFTIILSRGFTNNTFQH